MKEQPKRVDVAVEEWIIPTYPIPDSEEMPMFAETCIHQGTSGNPYPIRVVSAADGEHREDKAWTVVRLENDYIRLAVIPALGGRIFEAFDKVTGYDFLYRQHVIKPALIGAYGSWVSGGMEFNWPFHHRPSTVMPVDYSVEHSEDGSVTVWLSEHAPCDRTKGMVGIVLRPDSSYFETRMTVTNRTPHKHSFLWWENAAVAVHEDYRLVFPPDVTWVHHHNDASHTTYPLASGQYGADNITEPKDVSWHKNSRLATSYFAAPSKYDFFGGFDYRKNCGVLHIANHHVSPGKKLFTWGYGTNADNWEKKLTDSDGQYAELMAGSYTDDQPDFTWLAPYETKTFSQFWYPTQGIGLTTFATLDAAISLDREAGELKLNVTSVQSNMHLCVYDENGRVLLDEYTDLTPSSVKAFKLDYPAGEKLTVKLTAECGKLLLSYTEEEHDFVHIPKNNPGIPTPDKIKTPMELVTAGMHYDQYRHFLYKPDLYYLEALKREPNFLPALKALGEYYARTGRDSEALEYLESAWAVECKYNQNPEDGQVNYLRGVCLARLGRYDEAYDILHRAMWSQNVISPALTALSALDGVRGDYSTMRLHAEAALEKEARNPLALPYLALALYKLGDKKSALSVCKKAVELDCLNHLARYVKVIITGKGKNDFYSALNSNPAETVLDVAFDLLDAGFVKEAVDAMLGVVPRVPTSAMLHYTLAYCYRRLDDEARAARHTRLAAREKIVGIFPMRAWEERVLRDALSANKKDGFAAYLLGCLLYNNRDYDESAELFRTATVYIPDFYIPYRNLALLYFNHLDRAPEALPLMRRAIELHGGDATLLCEAATVMQKLGVNGAESAEYLDANKPEAPNDQILLVLARAYTAAGMFERAEELMRSHTFSPGEGAEYSVAEPYMYACFASGRKKLAYGDAKGALEDFLRAQDLPKNLNVGFWNESVMMPYRYYEAAARKALGQEKEADEIIADLSKMKNEGMWNMGGEFAYYAAMAVRLGGDEMRAQRMMRKAILAWEAELAEGCEYSVTMGGLYNCFVGNGKTNRTAALCRMLGYGQMYLGNNTRAREYFNRAQSLDPSPKIAFELELSN